MKIKNLTSIIFVAIFAINANSQSEYVLTDDYQKALKNVYEVHKKTIKTHRYEYKEIDNPKYLSLTYSIDSINKIIKIIKPLKKGKVYLSYALNNKPKQGIEAAIAFKKDRWKPLIEAKKYLDLSDLSFEQNIDGKYKVAIEQAKKNITKIDVLLSNYNSLSELSAKVNKLKNKISPNATYPINAKIFDYLPVKEIEREIIYLDSTKKITALTNILLPFEDTYFYKDEYKLVIKDFRCLVKGEFVSKLELEKVNTRGERGVADPIAYTGRIFKDKESGIFYFCDNDFWKKYSIDKRLNDVFLFLEQAGAKYYTDYGKYGNDRGTTYVEYKGHKCILDGIIMKALINKDITAINKMSSSVAQHKKLKDQASILANEIAKYYSANIKLLSSAQITAWKTATIKCDNLLKKMRKLPYATESEYYSQIRDEDNQGNKLSTIIDMTNMSKSKLGL